MACRPRTGSHATLGRKVVNGLSKLGELFLGVLFGRVLLLRIFPLTELRLDLRKAGLAFISVVEIPLLPGPFRATLVLKWIEVTIIGLIVASGALVFEYQAWIANTWIISKWAVSNQTAAAFLIGAAIFVLGCILAAWKIKQKFTYSITEMAFAVLAAIQIGRSLWPSGELSKFIGLGSALYVASRGAGNLWDAFVEEAKKEEAERVERVRLETPWSRSP